MEKSDEQCSVCLAQIELFVERSAPGLQSKPKETLNPTYHHLMGHECVKKMPESCVVAAVHTNVPTYQTYFDGIQAVKIIRTTIKNARRIATGL